MYNDIPVILGCNHARLHTETSATSDVSDDNYSRLQTKPRPYTGTKSSSSEETQTEDPPLNTRMYLLRYHQRSASKLTLSHTISLVRAASI
jgi:hypothetical protein